MAIFEGKNCRQKNALLVEFLKKVILTDFHVDFWAGPKNPGMLWVGGFRSWERGMVGVGQI